MMTPKDYVAIAAAVKNTSTSPALPASMVIFNVAYSLAETLAKGNPAFNRERFLKACGVQS